MALKNVKIEMKGTGGGRWVTREEAKRGSKKARRAQDKVFFEYFQDIDGSVQRRAVVIQGE